MDQIEQRMARSGMVSHYLPQTCGIHYDSVLGCKRKEVQDRQNICWKRVAKVIGLRMFKVRGRRPANLGHQHARVAAPLDTCNLDPGNLRQHHLLELDHRDNLSTGLRRPE